MWDENAEGRLSKLLAATLFIVGIIIYSATVTDPVNTPKLLVLVPLSYASLAFLGFAGFRDVLKNQKIPVIAIFVFAIMSLNSLVFTNTSFKESFFGIFGRNTGFLTYLSLSILFLLTLVFKKESSFVNLIYGFLGIAILNVFYCLLQILGADFMPWKKTFTTPVLGTFGNPNFIGAFLGISVVVFLTYLVNSKIKLSLRFIFAILGVAAIFEVDKSNAVQGLVVIAAGIAWIGLLEIKVRFSRAVTLLYLTIAGVLASIGVLGVVNIGPLAPYLFKPSITFRGEYWLAGIHMGLRNLLNGVGFDSYGSFYREARALSALKTPGVDTVSNSAHNVYIDIFASGGLLLLLSYFILTFLVIWSIIKQLKLLKKQDTVFTILSSIWICYQLQSIVSINQIGLAIIGWLFGGAIISYGKIASSKLLDENGANSNRSTGKRISKNKTQTSAASLITIPLAIVIGLLLAIPPIRVDSQWRAALVSRNPAKVELAAKAYPEVMGNLVTAADLFTNNNMPDKGLEMIELAAKKFPKSYDVWATMNNLPQVSQQRKKEALKQMLILDPNNPTLKG